MPLLLHIAFGNSHRLRRRSYLFEYAGVRFKLIQNDPRRWADVLLTIVPTHDAAAEQTAYSAAAEFLSALSWQNGSLTALQVAGGAGIGADQQLRDARCRVFAFPRVPFIGRIGGCSISPLPEVETEEQRTGLALFREARSSNTTWLSFLLHWQVLEVGGHVDPSQWINSVLGNGRGRNHVPAEDMRAIDLAGKTLGEYFLEDCRHAIAHIRRRPGLRALRLDTLEDSLRMTVSARVMERFAAHYLREVLALRKQVYLVRVGSRGLPVFRSEAFLRDQGCVSAYPASNARPFTPWLRGGRT